MIFLFDIAVTYNFNRTLEFLFSLHECLRVHGSLCLRLLLLIFNFIPQNRLPNHKQYCSIWKWRAFKICDFKFVAKKRDERGRGFLFRRVFAYKIEFWEVGYLMRSSYKHVVDYLRYFSSSRGVDLDEQQTERSNRSWGSRGVNQSARLQPAARDCAAGYAVTATFAAKFSERTILCRQWLSYRWLVLCF